MILRRPRSRKSSSSRTECNSSDEMGAVYAGWLTKSPEDKKGLLSLFAARKQWRRRYFVLYSAPTTPCSEERSNGATSHSTSPVLAYFEDETLSVRKGYIDLGNCEEIVDHVESCYYQHLFLLKTVTPRGHRRTYYLAADSSDAVTNWVRKLHSILNFDEDKLFTNAVLSMTESGSDVTGIIATVSNLEVNSKTSNTNVKKTSADDSHAPVTSDAYADKQLSHVQWLIVNSVTPDICSELLSNNAGSSESRPTNNSGTPVSKCGTKVTRSKVAAPFQPDVSAETSSTNPVSAESSSTGPVSLNASPSSVTSDQANSRSNESLSDHASSGETSDEYRENWPQFVKDLLDDGDGDEHQGTEKEETMEEKLEEGRSVFYFSNVPSLLPDKETDPMNTPKVQRPNLPQSNNDRPSTCSPSDVTCYLRITKGSRRYKSRKKRTQIIDGPF